MMIDDALCPRLGSSMFFTLPFPFLSFTESIWPNDTGSSLYKAQRQKKDRRKQHCTSETNFISNNDISLRTKDGSKEMKNDLVYFFFFFSHTALHRSSNPGIFFLNASQILSLFLGPCSFFSVSYIP